MYHQSCGCQNNNPNKMCYQNSQWTNGCPQRQPLVAPKKVCISQQVTPVAQPVICPIECRKINRCMYYPVYYPQYYQTYVNMPY